MMAVQPIESTEHYLDAIGKHNFDTARSDLADQGFEYVSPIARFNDPDAFAWSLDRVGASLARMQVGYCFTEGNDVCHVLDFTVTMANYKTQSVVQLAHVQGGKITRLEAIFDGVDYHRVFGAWSF